MKTQHPAFGAGLRSMREAAGMSARALAEALSARGIEATGSGVTAWERGEQDPRLKKVEVMDEILKADGRLIALLGIDQDAITRLAELERRMAEVERRLDGADRANVVPLRPAPKKPAPAQRVRPAASGRGAVGPAEKTKSKVRKIARAKGSKGEPIDPDAG